MAHPDMSVQVTTPASARPQDRCERKRAQIDEKARSTMYATALTGRPEAPAGPPKLAAAELRAAQAQTLDAPRLHYPLLARLLFRATDLAYGAEPGIVKFAMLEFIARVPYQAWERVGYLVLARHRGRSALATRVFDRIVTTRAEQDNEQWHLLILQDLVQRRGLRQRSSRT
jgi:ubiquinol oxidase